jgi:3-polyprenyl-4-hydroxybenzoate decarboxylase
MSSPALVRELQRRGFEIRIVATKSALRFVSALALEALTHHPVVRSRWPVDATEPVPHLALASWAEVVAIYPASATTLARIAQGSCASVVSALAVSAKVPVVLFPSMNEKMATAPAIRRNLELLREDGFYVVHAASGFEVADHPEARPLMIGAAPSISAAADLVQAIVGATQDRRVPPRASWDDLYASTPLEAMPWFTEDLDDDVAEILAREAPPPRRFLDIGTGPGTAAIAAARLGYTVVATDVSAHALEGASQRGEGLPITWVEDDAGDSRLRGSFDVLHDRGCLHLLPPKDHGRYVAAIRRLAAKGALVIVKTHGEGVTPRIASVRFTPSSLVALFGEGFDIVEARDATLGAEHNASLVALRRR